METDSNSIKKAATTTPPVVKTPLTPGTPGGRKQVGFAKTRPTLIIPPPGQHELRASRPTATSPYTAGTARTAGNVSATASNHMYNRKASAFVFEQLHGIKDFTKSGLGVGEKSAYWLYSKVRSWSRKWFTHMFLTIVLLLYTIGGALIFEWVEGQNEKHVEEDLRVIRKNVIRDLQNLSKGMQDVYLKNDFEGQAVQLMMDYEKELLSWHMKHKQYVGMGSNPQKKWDFWNSVVYCGTIYTTIGYGHIYPDTRTGKALTIVYAIIGIPLFLLALTDFGKLFTRCIKFLWSFVRRLYYTGSCRSVRKTAHVKEIFKGAQMMYEIATFRRPSMFVDPENPPEESPTTTQIGDDTPTTPAISNFEIDDEFNLPISLAIFILVLYIFLGGLIYCVWEGWDFFDSFYFVFISMSTVGFGDMVPADAACMIVSIVYLVFGLALMSMCINVVQVKLSDTFKQASTKIGATIGITVSEDDGSINTVSPDQVEIPQVHEVGAEPVPNTSSENDSNIQKENDQKKDS